MKYKGCCVYKHFESGNSITSLQAYNDLGITQLATRISELKECGIRIHSEWVKVVNRFNKTCHVKAYSLSKEMVES